jgi:hypothetical protein
MDPVRLALQERKALMDAEILFLQEFDREPRRRWIPPFLASHADLVESLLSSAART